MQHPAATSKPTYSNFSLNELELPQHLVLNWVIARRPGLSRRRAKRAVELGAIGAERPAVIGDRGAVGLMESDEGQTLVERITEQDGAIFQFALESQLGRVAVQSRAAKRFLGYAVQQSRRPRQRDRRLT